MRLDYPYRGIYYTLVPISKIMDAHMDFFFCLVLDINKSSLKKVFFLVM